MTSDYDAGYQRGLQEGRLAPRPWRERLVSALFLVAVIVPAVFVGQWVAEWWQCPQGLTVSMPAELSEHPGMRRLRELLGDDEEESK